MGAVRRTSQEGVTLHLDLSGKRAINYARYTGLKAEHTYTQFEDKPAFDEVEQIADRYLQAFISGKIDRVEVAYMKFLSAGVQKAVVETLLLPTVPAAEKPAAAKVVEYEFLPDAADILQEPAAGVVQGAAVQVLPGRGGQRADRPAGDDEAGDRER
ncbi:MAG: FoF1 ATP synthase subunit gamma [Gemmataceae bacterium]